VRHGAARAIGRAVRPALLAAVVLGGIGAGRVEAACTITVSSGVSFGTYNIFGGTPLDSTGQLAWRCSFLTFPTVRITLTKGGSTTYNPRRMRSGSETLNYNLFTDSARTVVWGDETEGTAAYYRRYPGWGQVTVSVFGRVPAGQDAAVGSYPDTVTVVINF
jgi:spore coat protein U-like protein